MITIPFDLELAKKINNGERNGMHVYMIFRSLILLMSILMMGRRKIGLFYKCIVNKAKDENSKII